MIRAALLILLWIATADQLTGQTGLPPAVRKRLSDSFPGWHFATLGPEHGASVPRAASPAWIRGDFDGDARRDYAVQVVTKAGPDSVQRVIAFLSRGHDYVPLVVDSFPVSRVVYLVRAPAGEQRADFEADPNGGTHVRLKHDGIDIVYAEAAASTCVYQAAAFRCIVSGD